MGPPPDPTPTGDEPSGLLGLERAGWRALSTGGDEAMAFYEDALARVVVFVLPGGFVLDDRDAVVESMGGAPWDAYELSDERVVPLTGDTAAVVYRARAERGGSTYSALFASTYVRETGRWKLAVHQQTPL
jgi:hypothetical protein